MYKRKDEGISPVIAVSLIIGLIAILAAVVGPVAINTITEFAVQEKSTVGVTVKLLPADDSMVVNLINGKDFSELSKYTLLVYYSDETNPFREVKPVAKDSQSDSYPGINAENAALINIVGFFKDGHSDLIFSGTVRQGEIVLSGGKDTRTVIITYCDEFGNPIDSEVLFVGERSKFGLADKEGWVFDGWYEDVDFETRWNGIATETMTVYASYVSAADKIKLKFYLQNLAGTDYEYNSACDRTLSSDVNSLDKIAAYISANPYIMPDGFDILLTGNLHDKIKFEDGVIKLYCDRLSYPVKYQYTSDSATPSGAALPGKRYYKYEEEVTVEPVSTVEGYAFDGWYRSDTWSSAESPVTKFDMPAADVTLYGKWVTNTKFTVIFVLGSNAHGSITSGNPVYVYENSLPTNISAPVVSLDPGYGISGWYRTADCSGDSWNFDTDKVQLSDFKDKEFKLYAKWDAAQYEIVYGNHGNSQPFYGVISGLPQTHTFGTQTTLPAPSLQSGKNYQFDGWCYADGSDANIISGSVVGDTGGKIHVYAKWTELPSDDHKIWFHPNPGSGEVSGASVKVQFSGDSTKYALALADNKKRYFQDYSGTGSVAVKLNLSHFSEMNVYDSDTAQDKPHKFCGWANSASASDAAYADGATVSLVHPESKHLYAIWSKNYYTITFNANGGSVSPAAIYVKKSSTGTASYPELVSVPSKTGSVFGGWYKGSEMIYNADGGFVGSSKTFSGDVTLKADWDTNQYRITYTSAISMPENWAASGTDYPKSAEYDEVISVSVPPKVKNMVFKGWKVTQNLDTATAKWGTGNNPSSSISSSTVCSNGEAGPVYFKNLNQGTATVTLEAQWEQAKGHYVVIHRQQNIANDDYSEVDRSSVTDVVAGTSVTPSVKTYAGFTSPSTKTVTVDEGETVYITYDYPRKKITVTWSSGVGSNSHGTLGSSSSTVKYGDVFTAPSATPSSGWSFAGWEGSPSSAPKLTQEGNVYKGTMNYDASSSITYTANWERGKCTVKFNANGHGTAPADQTVSIGDKVTKPSDLSADYYEFGGWYKESSCKTPWDFNSNTVNGALTLYAKWTPVTYKITFKSAYGITGGGSQIYILNKADVPTENSELSLWGAHYSGFYGQNNNDRYEGSHKYAIAGTVKTKYVSTVPYGTQITDIPIKPKRQIGTSGKNFRTADYWYSVDDGKTYPHDLSGYVADSNDTLYGAYNN